MSHPGPSTHPPGTFVAGDLIEYLCSPGWRQGTVVSTDNAGFDIELADKTPFRVEWCHAYALLYRKLSLVTIHNSRVQAMRGIKDLVRPEDIISGTMFFPDPEPKCECGAHATGSAIHSEWCVLAERKKP